MSGQGGVYYGIVPRPDLRTSFQGFKKRSRIVISPLFQKFIKTKQISVTPKRFPPIFERWHYAHGFCQFLRLKQCEVPASFKGCLEWVHWRWFSLSPVLSIQEAIEETIQASGASYTNGRWRKYGETKGEALRNSDCIIMLMQAIHDRDFGTFSMSLKDEIIKEGKYPRLFFPADLALLVACRMVYGPLMDIFMEQDETGLNFYLKDYPSYLNFMGKKLRRHKHLRSSDASGADTTMSSEIRKMLYESRRPYVNTVTSEQKVLLEEVEKALITPLITDPLGNVHQVEGNCSGSFMTLIDNSVVFYAVHLLTWIQNGGSFDDFEDNVTLYVTGDDAIWSTDHEWYDQAFFKTSHQLGFVHKDIEVEEEASYCKVFLRSEGDYHYPVREKQDAVDALWFTHNSSYIAACSTVQSLLIVHWFSEARALLTHYRDFLIREKPEGDMRFTWLTDEQIGALVCPRGKVTRFLD